MHFGFLACRPAGTPPRFGEREPLERDPLSLLLLLFVLLFWVMCEGGAKKINVADRLDVGKAM